MHSGVPSETPTVVTVWTRSALGHRLRDPKVHHLHPVATIKLARQHDVVWFEIAVDDPQMVGRGQRRQLRPCVIRAARAMGSGPFRSTSV